MGTQILRYKGTYCLKGKAAVSARLYIYVLRIPEDKGQGISGPEVVMCRAVHAR